MPRTARAFVAATLTLATLAAHPAASQIRTVALLYDLIPGGSGARFIGFPATNTYTFLFPIACNASGNCVFTSNITGGASGVWTDDLGGLTGLCLTGGMAPWNPGTATLTLLGQPLLSDNGHVAFTSKATNPATVTGLWIQDGAGLQLEAGDGEFAPSFPANTTFNFTLGNRIAINRAGQIALDAVDGGLSESLWSFDPPPTLNRYFCGKVTPHSSTGGFDGFILFGLLGYGGLTPLDYNDHQLDALGLTYWNGTADVNWMAEGDCGALSPVLVDGSPAPLVGTIPASCTITGIGAAVSPDINTSNSMLFESSLLGPGITPANNEVLWLWDASGWHAALHEGDPAPGLPGQTIGTMTGSGLAPILADDGTALVAGICLPSALSTVWIYHPDHTLHALARTGDPAPGFPGHTLVVEPAYLSYALNRHGQAAIQCGVSDGVNITNAVFMTDGTGSLVPVFEDGVIYPLRSGLNGSLTTTSVAMLSASGGSDGRVRQLSDRGEVFFFAAYTPTVGNPGNGLFAAQGPDLGPLVSAGATAPASATALIAVVPNPTRDAVVISFDLARAGSVRLEIFDLAGRRVKTLRHGTMDAGHYVERWSGEDDRGRAVGQGVYLARLTASDRSAGSRIVLVH